MAIEGARSVNSGLLSQQQTNNRDRGKGQRGLVTDTNIFVAAVTAAAIVAMRWLVVAVIALTATAAEVSAVTAGTPLTTIYNLDYNFRYYSYGTLVQWPVTGELFGVNQRGYRDSGEWRCCCR